MDATVERCPLPFPAVVNTLSLSLISLPLPTSALPALLIIADLFFQAQEGSTSLLKSVDALLPLS